MAKKKAEYLPPEWPHLFPVSELEKGQNRVTISPTEDQKAALCRRLDVDGIESLEAEMKLQPDKSGRVHVTGMVKAGILQSCVVSGDPVHSDVHEEFEAWFADPEAAVSLEKARRDRQIKKGNVELPVLDERDDPDAIIDGNIDLGELATQYLSLGINPYPHAEGVEYEQGDDLASKPDDHAFRNPFAKLKDWKARQEKE